MAVFKSLEYNRRGKFYSGSLKYGNREWSVRIYKTDAVDKRGVSDNYRVVSSTEVNGNIIRDEFVASNLNQAKRVANDFLSTNRDALEQSISATSTRGTGSTSTSNT